MERSFSTPEPVTLHVEIGSGEVHVDAREPAEQARVTVEGQDADEVTVEQRGNQIVVLAPSARGGLFASRGGDLTVTASVPRDSALSTKLGSADLVVAGRIGRSRLRSGSGDVRADELGGDAAAVETGSGDIVLDTASADLRVKSGSGDVEVRRLAEDAVVSTGSGDVLLGTSEQGVSVKSGSGGLQVREAHADLTLSTASGDISVGVVRSGRVQAKAVSGDVRIGVPPGIPVWTDIGCVSGRVSSNLDGAGQPEEGQDFIEIRITTVSGDVRLEQR